VLHQLHWLPVRQRITFKLAMITFVGDHSQIYCHPCNAVGCWLARTVFDDISGTGCPIDFVSVSRIGLSEMADQMELLPVAHNPRWRPAAILKISNDDLWNWINFDPINFLFHSRCQQRENHIVYRLVSIHELRMCLDIYYMYSYFMYTVHEFCAILLSSSLKKLPCVPS